MCRDYSAYLPHFSSKDEVEELVALLKLSEDTPPMQGFYIGLKHEGDFHVSLVRLGPHMFVCIWLVSGFVSPIMFVLAGLKLGEQRPSVLLH